MSILRRGLCEFCRNSQASFKHGFEECDRCIFESDPCSNYGLECLWCGEFESDLRLEELKMDYDKI